MLNTSNYDESRMAEACEAIRAQKKPNITKTAREFGVPRETLRDRVNKGAQARTARKPVNKALQDYQEKALIRQIEYMSSWNMPVTPGLIEEWAN